MSRLFICIVLIINTLSAYAQVTNTATLDTTDLAIKGKVTISGYIDAYYGYDFSNPISGNRPYSVSMNRHNEFTINLAFADIKYSSERFRARFVPAFGTYMNANYTNEPGTLKNILEGYIGIKLAKNREIWLDAGVLGSPYTNESAISKDHLVYTRSFAPEYVPYYLSGLKLTIPLSAKVNGYFYLLNGWQVIQDNNRGKSLGTQIEWRPTDKLLINWNTYIGDERSELNPLFRTRFFTDIYTIYNPNGKFSGTACFYVGWQEKALANTESRLTHRWWQANIIGRYRFAPKASISGRLEYFSDPEQVQIVPITQERGFSTYSASLGINIQPIENVMIRFESRTFFADKRVYFDNLERPSSRGYLAIANLTAFF
ncbi:MAG: porin [Microscillaceae bacterium]|jgi:hypothetical protein|nr:porin [Microscillaceae bacterium]